MKSLLSCMLPLLVCHPALGMNCQRQELLAEKTQTDVAQSNPDLMEKREIQRMHEDALTLSKKWRAHQERCEVLKREYKAIKESNRKAEKKSKQGSTLNGMISAFLLLGSVCFVAYDRLSRR